MGLKERPLMAWCSVKQVGSRIEKSDGREGGGGGGGWPQDT